jgi:hypothetical protein
MADLKRPLAIGFVFLPLVFILPNSLGNHYAPNYFLTEDYSENVARVLPPESIYITVSDSSYFPLAYKKFVEMTRQDILLLYNDNGVPVTQSSPRWSFKAVFPQLPVTGSFRPVSYPYLKDRELYTFDAALLARAFLSEYKVASFVNSYRLVPKDSHIRKSQVDNDFKKAFKIFDYKRAQKELVASDVYTNELKKSFFITLARYAYLNRAEGNPALSRKYYDEAILLMTPKGVAHYMTYLKAAELTDEMEAFVESLKPYADQYPNIRILIGEIEEIYL